MNDPSHFDLKQHLQDWHRFVLPLFVVIAAIGMVLFLALRTKENGAAVLEAESRTSRVGLLAAGPDAVFDPSFAVLSPIEMVLAPKTEQYDFPTGTEHGALAEDALSPTGDSLKRPVYAVSDGFALAAGQNTREGGNQVILLHERADGEMIGSFYGPLSSVRVPAGGQVRRGDIVGIAGGGEKGGDRFRFDLNRVTFPGPGEPLSESVSSLLEQWRGRPEDRLSAAPEGAPVEPSAFNLEVGEPSG